MSDHEELLELERRRCEAIGEHDVERLGALLTDDMTHIHAFGQLEGRDEYLGRLGKGEFFRRQTRGELDIRFYGDATAIMVGPQTVEVQKTADAERGRIDGIATQTWVRQDGGWRQASFQLTAVK